MRDSVLIISAISPTPVDNGKRMVLSGLLHYFVERLGPDNVHYALLGDRGVQRPDFPGIAHRLSRPTPLAQLAGLARMATDRSHTAQEAMMGSARLRREIHALVSWLRPTVEVYDTVRLGQHAPPTSPARCRVLYLDDLFSIRYDRILNYTAQSELPIDPLGEFVENIPRSVRSLVRRPIVYRSMLRMERDRMRRREMEVISHFDVSLLVNPREVEVLRQRTNSAAVRLMNGLLPASPPPVRAPVTPPEFVFLGRLNVPHNDSAISSFLTSSMTEVERRLPGVVVRLIGRGATDSLRGLVAGHPDTVRIEGFVTDLAPLFARVTASLAPLCFGTGIKIKILEALAAGVPVIGTRIALDGIPASDDGQDGCLVEDDLSKWPRLLAETTDANRNGELSRAALAFFQRTYGRDIVTAQYDEIFGLTGARDPSGSPASD